MKNVMRLYRELPVRKQEIVTAFAFITPFLAGYIFFNLLPLIYCFFISFIDWNGYAALSDVFTGKIPFVGLENFKSIFTDRIALQSLKNTFMFSLMYVPVKTGFALILALLLNKKLFLRGLSRSFMLMPYIANVVAIAMIFNIILDGTGPLNEFLRLIGFENPPLWLMNKRTALPTVVFIGVWQTSSYTAIIFLAALQNVPMFLYESASIDGASNWQKFWKITWPMISPTTFFVIINNTVQSFMNYALIKNLTDGGPGNATRTLIQNVLDEAFQYNHFSFGTAQAVFLFFIILIITLVQWKGQKEWVHY